MCNLYTVRKSAEDVAAAREPPGELDRHQRALCKSGVDAACRVGQDDGLDAHLVEDADRESDFFRRVAFI